MEATITANLDSYRERNVDLIFSDYNLDSADLNEIFRVPVTLGSASQTFTINLGNKQVEPFIFQLQEWTGKRNKIGESTWSINQEVMVIT